MATHTEDAWTSRGLYDPSFEHDACGVAFVATLRGHAGRDIVDMGLTVLKNVEHRGAVGAETETGDGAGILTQVPHAFLQSVTQFDLPEAGSYGVGLAFLTPGNESQETAAFYAAAHAEGVSVLGWRDVPVSLDSLGPAARGSAPTFRQVFVVAGGLKGIDLDRKLYRVRKRSEHDGGPFFASLSARTLTSREC